MPKNEKVEFLRYELDLAILIIIALLNLSCYEIFFDVAYIWAYRFLNIHRNIHVLVLRKCVSN